MLPFLFAAGTFFSTMLGGVFAIKQKDKQHLILGFMAGFLLGVVAFDILPEIFRQVAVYRFNVTSVMIALVFGFLSFHIAERSILLHHGHESEYAHHHHPARGLLSAVAFIGHSFMDGVGIGLGFQIGPAIGIVVATAVVTHDFTDGMNTATVMLASENSTARTMLFLVMDAVAPLVGVAATYLIPLSARFLVLYLGAFAGFLLYIGASDILPEAHSQHSSWRTVAVTVCGAVSAFVLSKAF